MTPPGSAPVIRALFVSHAFPRHADDLPGNFVLRLAAALRDQGVEVTALAPSAHGLAAEEDVAGVRVRRYRYAPRRAETLAYAGDMHVRAASPAGALAAAGLLAAGTRAARRLGRDADVVHAHWSVPGGVQALLAGRRPLVTTVHGTDVRLAGANPVVRTLVARALAASAVVTTVSAWLADQVKRIAPQAAGRVRVAPMPVDERLFTPPPAGAPREGLLFVGRLDRQKGTADAIRALPLLTGKAADLPLRVVGAGPEEEPLRNLAGALGVTGRVTWEPPLPPHELAERYRAAAALVVPSRAEGLGLVAVEGQLCGTPVVAAAAGGLLDVVKDGRTGRTFRPGDPGSLARAVSGLLTEPYEAELLAEHARAAALTRFGTRSAAATYAAVYGEAMDAAARGPARRP
jgi:glycosyltransferase involved in cell wall biosynthesis